MRTPVAAGSISRPPQAAVLKSHPPALSLATKIGAVLLAVTAVVIG
jgi:hypothetical protein